MKRKWTATLVVGALLAVFLALPSGTALADPPTDPGSNSNKPDEPPGISQDTCHGRDEVGCRIDPQSTHGNDCTVSDDHVCELQGGGVDPPDGNGPPGNNVPPAGNVLPGGDGPPGVVGGTNVVVPQTPAVTSPVQQQAGPQLQQQVATQMTAPQPGPVTPRSEVAGTQQTAPRQQAGTPPVTALPRTGTAGEVSERGDSLLVAIVGAAIAVAGAGFVTAAMTRRRA